MVELFVFDVVEVFSELDDEFFFIISEWLLDEDEIKLEVSDDFVSDSVKVGSFEFRGNLEIFDFLVGGFRNRV